MLYHLKIVYSKSDFLKIKILFILNTLDWLKIVIKKNILRSNVEMKNNNK